MPHTCTIQEASPTYKLFFRHHFPNMLQIYQKWNREFLGFMCKPRTKWYQSIQGTVFTLTFLIMPRTRFQVIPRYYNSDNMITTKHLLSSIMYELLYEVCAKLVQTFKILWNSVASQFKCRDSVLNNKMKVEETYF